jgi:hypothetical protein
MVHITIFHLIIIMVSKSISVQNGLTFSLLLYLPRIFNNRKIIDSRAEDPDIDETGDGDLFYAIRSSNLYRSGSTRSAGSLVPSPFTMEKNGRLVLATLVAEFNQVC